MAPTMLDVEEFERWMEAARRTLASARGDTARGDHNWACFKAQQSAELAVKAFLRGIGSPAIGHSVSRLLVEVSGAGIQVPGEILDCGRLLDKLYIPTRYPDAWSEGAPHHYYSAKDAEDSIRCSEKILGWVAEAWRRLSGLAGSGDEE